MRHILIAAIVGVATVGVLVLVMGNEDSSYQNDAEIEREISLNETFVGINYDLTPKKVECDTYWPIAGVEGEQIEGCVLSVEIKNTTDFDQILNLDGDILVDQNNQEFPSSDSLSSTYIEDNELKDLIPSDDTAKGGIFFEAPADTEVLRAEIFENQDTEPIIVTL